MPNRIVIVNGGRPEISEEFKKSLRAFDPSLHVSWNDLRKRFVIEQCIEHFTPSVAHDHTCRRIYVWLVRDEEDGSMMPLGEHVIEKLKSIDMQRQGYGPNDHAKWCKDREDERIKEEEKFNANLADSVKHASRFNRVTINKAIHKIQQHNLEVNQ